MKPFYVYIVQCADKSYYTGHTDDIEKRIGEHSFPTYPSYTSNRLPIMLVFLEEFPTRAEALACERQIKNWGKKKKEALIVKNWDRLKFLAKKRFSSSSLDTLALPDYGHDNALGTNG